MGAKNSKFLRDIVQLSANFIKYIKTKWDCYKKLRESGGEDPNEREAATVIDVMDCLVELDIYRLDFGALSAFFDKADLVRKLNGFI